MTRQNKIIIRSKETGIRIDKFLVELAKEEKDLPTLKLPSALLKLRRTSRQAGLDKLSRADFARAVKSGKIMINDKKVKPSYVLREGDEVKIKNQKSKIKNKKILLPNSKVKFKIIYKDENIIAVDKPAGLLVHPVELLRRHGTSPNNTLVNGLIAKFPEIIGVGDKSSDSWMRPGIVHRLDKDTSGVIVIARNQKSFDELKKLFKNRKIRKKYLAIVYGKLENEALRAHARGISCFFGGAKSAEAEENLSHSSIDLRLWSSAKADKSGVIEKPIARAGNYKKQVIAGRKTKTKIREAVTEYKVLKEFKNYSLVEARPRTGRMHQIRVHFFSLGHPIVGDKIYKNKRISKSEPIRVKRQLLHASQIQFELLGKKYSFDSPLPHDFDKFLNLIGS